jgi:predicted DNA binding CopG/RHH family protein
VWYTTRMKKKYAKSLPEYDEVEFDEEAVLNSRKIHRKMPTSVSLPPEIVEELKKVATKKGIPYQVLMRSFIIEGLQRLKEVS